MEASFKAIRDKVGRAELSAEVRQRILWGLEQMPPLYKELARTYESRFRDSILQQAQGMLFTLAKDDPDSPDAAKVMDLIVDGLRAMHERLGIPSLGLKIPAPAKTPRKKKAPAETKPAAAPKRKSRSAAPPSTT